MPGDVLIVEDDPIIALDFEDTILGFGVKTVRTAGSVAKALEMIADRAPDFALLDVGLVREKSFAVAERLEALKIPFAFVTGYGAHGGVSGGVRGQADTAETLFDRRAARPAEAPTRRWRRWLTGAAGRLRSVDRYPSLGSSVVDHSATSARSRKVTVICPLAPSILT